MIVYQHKLTNGVFGGSEMSFNSELINLADGAGYQVPLNFFPATLTKQLLENDFRKFRLSYNYYPDLQALTRAKAAFDILNLADFSSEMISFDAACDSMELSASPGFPWNKAYKTKRDCLLNERDQLRLIVQQIIDGTFTHYVFQGVTYNHFYWLTSPKSEIRPLEKLVNDEKSKRKCRTFMCSDIVTHIIGFMLYRNQNDNLLSRAEDKFSWSAVGLNPWYGGWDRMSRGLLRRGDVEFRCLDASHMEASLGDAIQTEIYEARNSQLHAPERLKDWFFLQLTQSLIIDLDGFVCQKFGKNPSGCYNTLTDNTLALQKVFLYELALNTENVDEILEAYYSIPIKMMGDDSITALDPRLATIRDTCLDLGFKLSLERPDGPLKEATFLNSSFYFNELRRKWVPCPNFDKIRANVFYNFKNRSWRLTFVKICSLRKLGYAFDDVREECDYYLQWIMKNKEREMMHEKCEELTFYAALSSLMPNHENDFLVYGDENFSLGL